MASGESTLPALSPSVTPAAKKGQLCLVNKSGGGNRITKKRGGEVLNVNCRDVTSEEENSFNPSGGADIKSKYKKALNKKTVEDLRKMAKGKGIKITTKKDGKSAYLKKSSIINKLCDMKHPKKATKKTTKRK